MHDYTVASGFLIVKTFARMCREYLVKLKHRPELVGKGGYSVPCREIDPNQMTKQYRGLMREPIQGWVEALRGSGVVEPTDQELEASLFLTELDKEGKSANDFVFTLTDANRLLEMIEPSVEREILWPTDAKKLLEMAEPPVEREILWVRCVDEGDPPPPSIDEDDPILRETVFLGFDASAFYPPECNSAIAESMFFVYWLADDEERVRFKAYHKKLNRWGLFDTPEDAAQFLEAYRAALPADADERHYGHRIVEVRALA